jgi:hypothetical protein
VARTRTTKKLAQRIDLNYFKRPTPLKRAKLWLSLLLPLLALVWIAWRGFSGDHRVYSSGRMSRAHAVLEKECAACHVQQADSFSAKADSRACASCHDGPVHHSPPERSPNCAACHTEHRGRVNLLAASNQACGACHRDLQSKGPGSKYENHIVSLEDSHPEFAAVRTVDGIPARDPGTIRLNHAIHLKPIRRGPTGPTVNLECGNCHYATAANADLTYADSKYLAAAVSYTESSGSLSRDSQMLRAPRPITGRELMAPVKFANACASCHLLTFDKRFEEGVPHDKTEVVHAFLGRKFREYIAAHPGESRVVREPTRDLTGKPLPPEVRILTPAQWVTERTSEAEDLLWRKTCKQCHVVVPFENSSQRKIETSVLRHGNSPGISGSSAELPSIAPAHNTLQWMPHARFDHGAHTGFTCVSCHEKAPTSTETTDVLLPGIATCQTCHAPGPDHAESRCFECHTYHDWSKRKEVKPTFTLPALRTGNGGK